MAASITDKVTKASSGTRPSPTTLTALRSIGASSITTAGLTGWPTDTAVHFVIYSVDTSGNKVANSQTDWKGVVSGSTITNLTLKAGTDNGDSVGAIVEATPTAAWADDLATHILTHADQDGTLKAGAVDVAGVLASDVVTTAKILNSNVTTAKIADSNITTAKIADGNVTPAKLVTGSGTSWAWQSWTPTLTGITLGNGTLACKYSQVGKIVIARFSLTFGSTSSMGSGVPDFTLPVTAASETVSTPLGVVRFSTTINTLGTVRYASITTADFVCNSVSGGSVLESSLSSTTPGTWGTGSTLTATFTYEAA